jgi:hypothetical protein
LIRWPEAPSAKSAGAFLHRPLFCCSVAVQHGYSRYLGKTAPISGKPFCAARQSAVAGAIYDEFVPK